MSPQQCCRGWKTRLSAGNLQRIPKIVPGTSLGPENAVRLGAESLT